MLSAAVSLLTLLVVVVLWRGAHGFNDFYTEALPSYRALGAGHFGRFAQIGPAYTGSLLLRAPFALLAIALGGGGQVIYIATALPCILAVSILGIWLGSNLPFRPERPVKAVATLVFCALNPIVVVCLAAGHPEELLGAALCIGAVVLAQRGDMGMAGVATGLAIVDETWALVLIPVLLAVLPARRWRTLATLTATAGIFLLPLMIARQFGSASSSVSAAATSLGSSIGSIFLPPQLLWWFGAHSWIAMHAREIIVVVPVPCAALWWYTTRHQGRQRPGEREPLLLLALVLLLRAALDPWDNLYYHVPFLLTLMVYEADRLPRLTAYSTVFLMVVAPPFGLLSNDGRAIGYALFALPLVTWLAGQLYRSPVARGTKRRRPAALIRRLGRVVG